MHLFSPAKINLFLRVLRKREDGYHDLASLFQAIDLGDKLRVELSDKDALSCSDPSLPCDSSNLVLKAVRLFREKTGLSFAVKIHLEKAIPLQSGLGGGSSNAATVLWGVNALLGFPATVEELKHWSASIGSDIPFFFSLGTAYCTGKGEEVRCIPPLRQLHPLWVIKPPEGLSTPLIFKTLNLNNCSSLDPEECLKRWMEGTVVCLNDLESPAFEVLPSLQMLKNRLFEQGINNPMLTGSGTSVFYFGDTPPRLRDVSIYHARFHRREEGKWY